VRKPARCEGHLRATLRGNVSFRPSLIIVISLSWCRMDAGCSAGGPASLHEQGFSVNDSEVEGFVFKVCICGWDRPACMHACMHDSHSYSHSHACGWGGQAGQHAPPCLHASG